MTISLWHLAVKWHNYNSLNCFFVVQGFREMRTFVCLSTFEVLLQIHRSLLYNGIMKALLMEWWFVFDSLCRLKECSITEEGCIFLASALMSNPSHLRFLNLGNNELGHSGVKQISDLLQNPLCKLQKLWCVLSYYIMVIFMKKYKYQL